LRRGANVVVNYAGSKDAAEAVAKEIEGMGVKSLAVKVCLSPFLSCCCGNGASERVQRFMFMGSQDGRFSHFFTIVQCDTSNPDEVTAMFKTITESFDEPISACVPLFLLF